MQPRRRTKLAREHEATRSTPACTSDCFVLTGLQTSSELRANTSTGLTIHDEVGQSIGVSEFQVIRHIPVDVDRKRFWTKPSKKARVGLPRAGK